LVINGILKNQNIKLYRCILPFLIAYQQFMEVDPLQMQRMKYESIEVYSKLSINSNLINTFIKTYEKEKYFFFPGVDEQANQIMSATRDRKRVSNLVGNVLLSIRIEPDYLYKSKTLFRENVSAKVASMVYHLGSQVHPGSLRHQLQARVPLPSVLPLQNHRSEAD
jgi:hypothetical protein